MNLAVEIIYTIDIQSDGKEIPRITTKRNHKAVNVTTDVVELLELVEKNLRSEREVKKKCHIIFDDSLCQGITG